MERLFEKVFVDQSEEELAGLEIPSTVKELWRERWRGKLGGSDAANAAERVCIKNVHLRNLVVADEALRLMKIGGSSSLPCSTEKTHGGLASFVRCYGDFSRAFYADHSAAWTAWRAVFWLRFDFKMRLLFTWRDSLPVTY